MYLQRATSSIRRRGAGSAAIAYLMKNIRVDKNAPLSRNLHVSIVYQKERNKLLKVTMKSFINFLVMLEMFLILLRLSLKRKRVRKRKRKRCKKMDYL